MLSTPQATRYTNRTSRAADRLPALHLLQHPDAHRPERPVLLAVDQQLGEGARGQTLRLELEAVEELVRQLAGGQAADTLGARCFGRMRLASLTRSDQRRVGISFGS